MGLRPAADFRAAALEILAAQRAWLTAVGIPGELVLVGGSSVAGALTKGDVDLHLRVPVDRFERVRAELERHLTVVHPEIWCSTLATFEVSAALPTGLAVTPVESEHDVRFSRCWRLLASDPALVTTYNAMKLADDGPDGPAYEARKSVFFDQLLELWPQHPAGGLSSR